MCYECGGEMTHTSVLPVEGATSWGVVIIHACANTTGEEVVNGVGFRIYEVLGRVGGNLFWCHT